MKKKIFTSLAMLGLCLFSGQFVLADSQTQGEVNYIPGALEFDYTSEIPTDLNFGEHPIQTVTPENWIATTTGEQTAPATTGAVDVRDNRGDLTGTWLVKVAQVEQFQTSDEVELTDAVLSLSFGSVTNNLSLSPTSTYENDELAIQVFNQEFTVLSATAGENSGNTSLAIDQFSLAVPANTNKVAAEYTTTLNWTFSSTPEP